MFMIFLCRKDVMFDKMAHKIDAVIISTPDHSHFPATMAAMQFR